MAKKKPTNGAGPKSQSATVERREKAPNFVSLYSNDIQVQTSPWDVRLVLGSVIDPPTPDDPVLRVVQVGEVRFSPQLAKRLIEIIATQLKTYEERFGEIPVPPNE